MPSKKRCFEAFSKLSIIFGSCQKYSFPFNWIKIKKKKSEINFKKSEQSKAGKSAFRKCSLFFSLFVFMLNLRSWMSHSNLILVAFFFCYSQVIRESTSSYFLSASSARKRASFNWFSRASIRSSSDKERFSNTLRALHVDCVVRNGKREKLLVAIFLVFDFMLIDLRFPAMRLQAMT